MSAQQVLLWRHGRTRSNSEQRFQGQLDVPLDDVGRRQSAVAAEELARIAGAVPPVRVVSSDLSRAAESAQALARRLDLAVELDTGLREVFAGAWEGLTRTEIIRDWPDAYAAWRRGDDVPVGGGETRGQAAARAAAVIERLDAEADGGTVVVVSHGGALRGAVFLLLGLEHSAWRVLEVLRNAHWAQLAHRPEGWVLGAYNVGVVAESAADHGAVGRSETGHAHGHGHGHPRVSTPPEVRIAQPE